MLILAALLPAFAAAQAATPTLLINGRLCDAEKPALLVEEHLFVAVDVLTTELGVQTTEDKGLWRLKYYDHELCLRGGERTLMVDGVETQGAFAPLLQGTRLYVPVALVTELLQIVVTHAGDNWHLQTPPANVLQIRQGVHEDRVRFVLDLAAPASFRTLQEPGKLVLELPVGPDQPEVLRLHDFEDPLARQVTETVKDGALHIAIAHESPEPPQFMTLGDPARIVVDLLREQAACTIVEQPPVVKPLPGDIWNVYQFRGSRGPVRGFVIRFNPATTRWALRPELAGATIMRRRTVSRMAGDQGAYAAINGGFFAAQGPPLGLLVIGGEWIKGPLYHRAALGVTREGEYHIANVDFSGRVEFEGLGMLPLDRINEGHLTDDTVVAFTPRWGPLAVAAPDKTRLAVGADGRVVALYPPNADAPIPAGGFVVSGNGHRAQTLAGIAVGTKVTLRLDTTPRWPGLWHAVGGGPLLVADGKVVLDGKSERFRNDVIIGCRPRSAVGLTGKNEVIVVAIEEPGMTLRELANALVKLGAVSAMNLDGGGSTAIVVNGRLLNRPGDGCERPVSNAILVVKR